MGAIGEAASAATNWSADKPSRREWFRPGAKAPRVARGCGLCRSRSRKGAGSPRSGRTPSAPPGVVRGTPIRYSRSRPGAAGSRQRAPGAEQGAPLTPVLRARDGRARATRSGPTRLRRPCRASATDSRPNALTRCRQYAGSLASRARHVRRLGKTSETVGNGAVGMVPCSARRLGVPHCWPEG